LVLKLVVMLVVKFLARDRRQGCDLALGRLAIEGLGLRRRVNQPKWASCPDESCIVCAPVLADAQAHEHVAGIAVLG